jgi:hypothetical protein
MPMRLPIYTVAIPILAAVAFAQDTPPVQPKQPTESAAPSKAGSDRPAEVKTQTYSGTLMDASCAGSGSAAPTSTSSAGSTAPTSTSSAGSTGSSAGSAPGSPAGSPAGSTASTSSADRAAPSADQSCAVAASTTQFALKMKDGTTVRFDDVGNTRVQEAMKTRKKWSDSAAASKPIRVKANGVLNGDKLTVLSID